LKRLDLGWTNALLYPGEGIIENYDDLLS